MNMKEMPKFGMITNPSEDIIKEINRAYRLGMDYVELGMEAPEGLPKKLSKKKNRIIVSLKKFSCPAIGHTAYWADLGSSYENIRKAWIEEMKTAIIVSKKLGIKKLNVHLTAMGIRKRKQEKQIIDNYINSLKKLVRFAKKYDIKIILENTPHEWSRFENFCYIIKNVHNLGVHLDIGHAFITDGMGGINKFISYFDKKIEHIHMHDNHGKEDEHLCLGKGKINFNIVIKALKKIGYNKTITFEVFTSKADFLKSINIFKRAWLK